MLDVLVSFIHMGVRTKRAFWRRVYGLMARRFKNPELRFMNYGWAPPGGDDPTLALQGEDADRRRWIQLYHHVIRDVDMAGKTVVEIGSGRGGGAAWVARSSGAAMVTGIDFSQEAVDLCEQIHAEQLAGADNLRFQQGDAEALPLEDNSVDVILNVESSHCYGNMEAFASEAARVLKADGTFCWADLWLAKKSQVATGALDGTGLTRTRAEDITEGVLRSLNLEGAARSALLARIAPWFMQPILQAFGGVPGTSVYNGLKSGKIVYLCRRYVKAGLGLVAFALSTAAIAPTPAHALSVYVESTKAFADFSVYVEPVEAFADCVIYKEPIKAFATEPQHWHFEPVDAFADRSIYFESVKAFADLSIAYTTVKAFAKCDKAIPGKR